MDTQRFVVFHPFASRFPFETWIVPKEHQASFGLISMEDSKQFAKGSEDDAIQALFQAERSRLQLRHQYRAG